MLIIDINILVNVSFFSIDGNEIIQKLMTRTWEEVIFYGKREINMNQIDFE